MDVREKLVELLGNLFCGDYGVNGCDSCKYNAEVMCSAYACADHLIAHGVTVQEWISAKDRLPEKDEIVTICTEKGFVYAGELIGDTWFLDNDSWTENVTHWMPLPKPPKGE